MKLLALGVLIGSGMTVACFLLIYQQSQKMNIGDDKWVEYSEHSSGDRIKVYRGGESLFSATIASNAFSLRVPSDFDCPETILFSEIRQEGRKIQKLVSSRRMSDGKNKTVQYDMDTGEVDMIFLSSPDGEVEAFDGDGKLIEINQSEQSVSLNSGQLRHPS